MTDIFRASKAPTRKVLLFIHFAYAGSVRRWRGRVEAIAQYACSVQARFERRRCPRSLRQGRYARLS